MQNRQTTMWRESHWRVIMVLVATGALGLLALASAGASAMDGPLKQECIAASLKKPKIGKVGVRHAGSYGGGTQFIYLDAQYGAMPEACHDDNIFRRITDDIYRDNQAKGQILRNGKWTNIINWSSLYGGVVEGDPSGETTWSNVNNQVAFKGAYESEPPLAHTPTHFDQCRVRILLKESAIRPWPLGYKGRRPPPIFGARIYKVNVPIGQISPHRGKACSLLVPGKGL
jgi:hypothetical protein